MKLEKENVYVNICKTRCGYHPETSAKSLCFKIYEFMNFERRRLCIHLVSRQQRMIYTVVAHTGCCAALCEEENVFSLKLVRVEKKGSEVKSETS